jgi:CubicO group peptidase (beta-lactamase class C family)
MKQPKRDINTTTLLQILGTVILVDALIFVVVGLSCSWGRSCSTDMWSERLFWSAIGAFIIGMPGVIAALNTGSGVESDPMAAAWAQKAALATIKHERKAMGKRMQFFVTMFLIGAIAIGMSALVDSAGLGSFVAEGVPPDFSKPDRALRGKVASAVDKFMTGYLNYVPLAGSTLAIYEGSGPVYIKGYGHSDLEAAEPAGPETVYRIGGLTQQFTAAAILRLAEQGELDLEASVTQYLTDLPPAFEAITLHHLLSHISGLPGDADVAEALATSTDTYTPEDLVALSTTLFHDLLFTPGAQWHYSEQGYRLLGAVIEAVAGRAYGDYLQDEFLGPLGLGATGYCQAPPDELAAGYIVEQQELTPAPAPNVGAAYAAEGLCSTAGDLVLWQFALAEGEVVAPDLYAQMIAPTELANGETVPYGYGTATGSDLYGGTYAQLQGKISGFDGILRHYPDESVIVVILANTTVPDFREAGDNGLDYAMRKVISEIPLD